MHSATTRPRKAPKPKAPKPRRAAAPKARASRPSWGGGRPSRRGGTSIKHPCGHTQQHALKGMKWQKDREKLRLAEQVCTSCWAESRAAELEALCCGANLPELTGTDAQILWARSIRALAIIKTHGEAVVLDKERVAVGLEPAEGRFMRLVLPYFEKKKAAKFWIDNREETDLLSEIVPFSVQDELAALRGEISKVPVCPF